MFNVDLHKVIRAMVIAIYAYVIIYNIYDYQQKKKAVNWRDDAMNRMEAMMRYGIEKGINLAGFHEMVAKAKVELKREIGELLPDNRHSDWALKQVCRYLDLVAENVH